ncbi:MAG TPA: hypothetical protein PKC88_01070 [Plasticicumulans sp.]|nr:hypothetical protein [Plasticicumulans sp.]
MSSRRPPPPFEIAIGRSPRLLLLQAVLHALALLAIGVCRLPGGLSWGLAGVVLASFGRELDRYRRPRWRALAADAGGWALVADDGSRRALTPVSAYVHPWLVIVRYVTGSDGWWPRALLIAADAADTQALRRLRVRLRLYTAVEP